MPPLLDKEGVGGGLEGVNTSCEHVDSVETRPGPSLRNGTEIAPSSALSQSCAKDREGKAPAAPDTLEEGRRPYTIVLFIPPKCRRLLHSLERSLY